MKQSLKAARNFGGTGIDEISVKLLYHTHAVTGATLCSLFLGCNI